MAFGTAADVWSGDRSPIRAGGVRGRHPDRWRGSRAVLAAPWPGGSRGVMIAGVALLRHLPGDQHAGNDTLVAALRSQPQCG